MPPTPRTALDRTIELMSDRVVYDLDECDRDDLLAIMKGSLSPMSMSAITPYKTKVSKIGNTHGFTIEKSMVSHMGLKVGTELQIILRHPKDSKPNQITADTEEVARILKRYKKYFRLPEDLSPSDIDFSSVGKKVYIPIYRKLSVIGTSYCFYVAIDVLTMFGFEIGSQAEIIIRKV